MSRRIPQALIVVLMIIIALIVFMEPDIPLFLYNPYSPYSHSESRSIGWTPAQIGNQTRFREERRDLNHHAKVNSSAKMHSKRIDDIIFPLNAAMNSSLLVSFNLTVNETFVSTRLNANAYFNSVIQDFNSTPVYFEPAPKYVLLFNK
jgi:hypothetical protein